MVKLLIQIGLAPTQGDVSLGIGIVMKIGVWSIIFSEKMQIILYLPIITIGDSYWNMMMMYIIRPFLIFICHLIVVMEWKEVIGKLAVELNIYVV